MSALFDYLLNPEQHHQGPVLSEGDIHWDLNAFKDQIFKLSAVLKQQGINPGDRVALMLMNQKEYLVSFFATLCAGGVVVPVNIAMPHHDIAHVIQNSGAKVVVAHASFAPLLQNCPLTILLVGESTVMTDTMQCYQSLINNAEPDTRLTGFGDGHQMRILMYTSGTTGKPKGVMLSESNLLSNLDGIRGTLELDQSDRMLLALPLFHAYGQIIALYALRQKARLYLVPTFAPKNIVQTLRTQAISVLPLVPTMFTMLLSVIKKYPDMTFPHLTRCVSGGASLPEKLLRQIESSFHLTVLEGYGLTETSPVIAVNCFKKGSIPNSVGQVLENVVVKLVDDNGTVLSAGASEAGEILVKAPSIMQGYYNLPEDTTNAFDEAGYFRTGDLGHLDHDGNLYISSGRKKDLIIRAGENIAPVQIETILYQHEAVIGVAVFGIPDEKMGEEMVACIECQPEVMITGMEAKHFCLESLPAFMVPKHFWVLDQGNELPRNPLGKILKAELREQWNEMQKEMMNLPC